ncbi:chaperone protein HscB [Salmonella enterica subsp. enterica]|uniref:Chaperone protein HscB n=1 Tax=Salmonella enterica I TaxID=59201 RepID=A0A379WNZ6_SALET|nr:chaperone protein HscB [Salmonella enterica subsp. enterica]
MDYFTLFGLPARYQIDTQALSLRFQDLQRSITLTNLPTALRRSSLPPSSNPPRSTRPGKRCVTL